MKNDDKIFIAWTILFLLVLGGSFYYGLELKTALYSIGGVAFLWIVNIAGNYFYNRRQDRLETEREVEEFARILKRIEDEENKEENKRG